MKQHAKLITIVELEQGLVKLMKCAQNEQIDEQLQHQVTT